MSLFPAAGSVPVPSPVVVSTLDIENKKDKSWLSNDSYDKNSLVGIQTCNASPRLNEDQLPILVSKVKKSKKKKLKKKSKFVNEDNAINSDKKKQRIEITNNTTEGKISAIVDFLTTTDKFYFSDRKCDKDNVYFHRPYKVDLPKFKRPIFNCIGAENVEVGLTKKGKDLKKKKSRFDGRYFSKENRKTLLSQSVCGRLNTKAVDRKCFSPAEVFIHLGSIESVKKETDSDLSIKDGTPRIFPQVEELNKHLRENPNDIESWLKLVELQDEIFPLNLQNRSKILSEKKISILEKALKENSSAILLRRTCLELKSQVTTDHTIMEKEWSEAVFKFPGDLQLWESFIQYMTGSSTIKFTVQKTEKSFGRCIYVLRAMHTGSFRTSKSLKILESNILRIFRQYIDFLWSCGYMEKGFLCLLYLLELNFRKPQTKDSLNYLLDSLEKFYGSNQRKLGEDGSQGWDKWHGTFTKGGWVQNEPPPMQHGEGDEEDIMEIEESLINPHKSLAENWLAIEKHRNSLNCLNNIHRFSNLNHENFIPFSSFKQVLFLVQSEDAKVQLCQLLIHLTGLPISYVTTEHLMFKKQGVYAWSDSSTMLSTNISTVWVFKPLLFSKSQPLAIYSNNEMHKFILDVFEQLLISTKNQTSIKKLLAIELVEYFENRILFLMENQDALLKRSGKEACKTAKYILKQHPDLLEIWCKLCNITWLLQNYSESVRIVQQMLLLTMNNIGSKDIQEIHGTNEFIYIVKICTNIGLLYLQFCLQNHTFSNQVKNTILLTFAALGDGFDFSSYYEKSLGDELTLSSTDFVKICSGFTKTKTLLQQCYKSSEKCTGGTSAYCDFSMCFILFQIFCKNFKNVGQVFTETVAYLNSQQISEQLNCDLEHMFLYQLYYMTNYNATRGTMREAGYCASSRFPNNPIFAKIITDIDMPSYLSSNVHRHFAQICKGDLIIPWVCAIDFELQRKIRFREIENATENLANHRLLNLLKRGTTTTNSPMIWRLYLSIESNSSAQNAKDIYLRAIDACPWSSSIYMDFVHINTEMLKEIVEMMEEKGLIVRTPIEEIELLMAT